MTSPPLGVTRPRIVTGLTEFLMNRDAAVAEEDVGTARVERGDLVVVAGVVALGDVRAVDGPSGPSS